MVPGHSGHDGNKEADRLTRLESENYFFEPELALGTLKCFLREVVECSHMDQRTMSEMG